MLGRHDRSPRLRTFARRLRARSTDGCVTQSAAYFFSPLPVLRGRVGVGVERRLASETPTLTLPLLCWLSRSVKGQGIGISLFFAFFDLSPVVATLAELSRRNGAQPVLRRAP